jgi:hypothetical protein
MLAKVGIEAAVEAGQERYAAASTTPISSRIRSDDMSTGFSQKIALPAFAALLDQVEMRVVGVPITTASMSGLAMISSEPITSRQFLRQARWPPSETRRRPPPPASIDMVDAAGMHLADASAAKKSDIEHVRPFLLPRLSLPRAEGRITCRAAAITGSWVSFRIVTRSKRSGSGSPRPQGLAEGHAQFGADVELADARFCAPAPCAAPQARRSRHE